MEQELQAGRSISVVIPNFNGRKLLEENLPAVYKALATAAVPGFEIIVPDDNSSDESMAFLKANYPDIIRIESKTNKGFSSNVNKGIRAATKELVLILNSDVLLTDDYFVPLLPYFNKPDTFGVAGKIIGLVHDEVQDAAKYPEYSATHIKATTNFQIEDDIPEAFLIPSLYLSGANALVDRMKLIELGGFDELFSPFYYEDLELSIRAWRLGYSCYYEPAAVCRHPNSVTINKYNSRKKVNLIATRNKFFLNYIHRNGVELGLWWLIIVIKSGLRCLIFNFRYYKAFRMFLAGLPAAKVSKQKFRALQLQHRSTLSLKEIADTILDKIEVFRLLKH